MAEGGQFEYKNPKFHQVMVGKLEDAESASQQFSSNLKHALSVCPWTAALLHLFIDKQKEFLDTDRLQTFYGLISTISEYKEYKGQETSLKLFDVIENLVLPHTVGGEHLQTVKDVMNFTIKELLRDETKAIYAWNIFFAASKELSTDNFAQKVETFIGTWPVLVRQRLTEQLSHQFHARAAGFHEVDKEEEEEGGASDT